jgi:hypothetical protein
LRLRHHAPDDFRRKGQVMDQAHGLAVAAEHHVDLLDVGQDLANVAAQIVECGFVRAVGVLVAYAGAFPARFSASS